MTIARSAIALLLVAAGSTASADGPEPIAVTEAGTLRGTVENGEAVFRGIPYAAPPIAALRWRAPQPAIPWTGTRLAERFGAICVQPARPGPAAQPQSEDCLFLNVFRPAGNVRGLPVLFWIPGGGFSSGSGSEPDYDGKALAARGAVVVTINYRVGRLGFFAHPDLTRENADGGRLNNYGLMDQIAALEWVKRNIAAFGGDPAKVTIFGESAGGASVDALMVSPAARGLFRAAISESGYGRGTFPRLTTRSADGDPPAHEVGATLAAKLGMPNATLAELRALPADRILTATDLTQDYNLVIDGVTMTSDIWAAFAHGAEAPVPFMLGTNSYEMGAMASATQRPWAEAVVPPARWNALTPFYGSEALRDRLLLSDIIFTSQTRAIAARHAANGHPTYVYRFDVPSGPAGAKLLGASHAGEIPYVFGNLTLGHLAPAQIDTADRRISSEMMGFWLNMARTRDPNGAGLPKWPRYRQTLVLHIAKPSTAATPDPLTARLDHLDGAVNDIFPEDKQP